MDRPNAIIGTPVKFMLENIYFRFNKSELDVEAIMALEKNLKILESHPAAKIELSANTDSRGSKKYNRELSKRRGNVLIEYLKFRGLSNERILSAIANGESNPVNKCVDGVKCGIEEHKLNRRVEFKIIELKK